MMKKRVFIIGIIILSFFFIYLFRENNTKSLLSLKEVKYNGNNLQISIDGNSSDTLPTSGNYYLARYDCKSSDTTVTWDRTNYTLDVSNSNKKGGVSCYLDFQTHPKLSDMPAGSYVSYTGNNGCEGNHCKGENANYVDDATNMGYCSNSSNRFSVNGWRIGYTKDGSAYLISAGAPECLCTDSSGNVGTSCSKSENTSGVPKHLANLNQASLKYCNQVYAYNGVCDGTSGWNVNGNDYQELTLNLSTKKSLISSIISYRKKSYGVGYDLIDNGGYYWFATPYSASSTSAFRWFPNYRSVISSYSSTAGGVRPVLRLQSSVIVLGGSGTYEDPYTIGNNTFNINNGNKYVNASEASQVKLTLVGLSGVSQMCINTDSTGCSNYIDFASSYTLNWSGLAEGKKIVYVYYKDSSGKIVASMNRSIILDKTTPTNKSVSIGDGKGLTRTLTISSTGASQMCFSNTSNSASNCTNWVDYATSYTWRLSDGTGSKTVYAFFRDEAGNISSKTATTTVTSIVEFVVNEDFADSTFDSNITVTGSGDYPWIVSSGQFQSNNVGKNSTDSISIIEFTPTVGATLYFDYGVSSEPNWDKLTIELEGNGTKTTLVNAISGTKTGTISDITLKENVTYTLRLTYSKDRSSASGSDIGYIRSLRIQS